MNKKCNLKNLPINERCLFIKGAMKKINLIIKEN